MGRLAFAGELGGRDSHSRAFFRPGNGKYIPESAKIRASGRSDLLTKLLHRFGNPICLDVGV